MKRFLIVPALLLAGLCLHAQVITPEHQKRAADLVKQMTLDEKISLVSGYRDGFHTAPVERLGIPEIRMADGPQGVRNNTKSTLFACGVAAAASWNPDLVREMGVALGQDARARGVHILLGPGVNICRSPLCGRNFEYFGEDPFLAAETAVSYIGGVQSQGVMATIKHFALNNLEYDRHHTNSIADERTMNEIYFPAFRAAVERANVASVMTSYNLVNGVHSSENAYLIEENLRGKWNFSGFTMSDWTSTYSPVLLMQDGVDLEMPRGFCMNKETLEPLLRKGVVTEAQLDAKVQRILQTFIAFGFLDRPQLDSSIPEDNPYSREVAYKLACESAVLLKNDGILPLGRRQKVSVSGPAADVVPCGGGSGAVDPLYAVSLRDGLQQFGARLFDNAPVEILALGFDKKTEYEDGDRTFALPDGQEALVEAALARGHKVVLIVNAGGAVDLSRLESRVNAILWAWYPGQEGGKALAEILYGKIGPSGRLPVSFPSAIEDNPSQANYYPPAAYTKRGHSVKPSVYAEGVFVGYRGYGETAPLYPFGFGLDYTSFSYGPLSAVPSGDGFDVTLDVTNTGKRAGTETVQLYVHEDAPAVPRPERELKAFKKVKIGKGKTVKVSLHLSREAFAYYDVVSHGWKVNPGTFTLEAGASAADIRSRASVDVRPAETVKAAKVMAEMRNPDSKYVIVAAHRGDWRNYPENSIAAIESAIRMGVDIVEIDLKLTRDSVLVLSHDATCDRMTTGKGKISEMTWDALKNCNLRTAHNVRLPGTRIATLREALLACKDRIVINVDQGYEYYDLVLAETESLGMTDQILIKGKMPRETVAADMAGSSMMYMPIIDCQKARGKELFGQYESYFSQTGESPLAYEVCFSTLDDTAKDCCSKVLEQGSKLWLNTLWGSLCGGYDDDAAFGSADPGEVYGVILGLGASIIQTDRPQLLISWLEKQNRR